jgi:hypothetical protein
MTSSYVPAARTTTDVRTTDTNYPLVPYVESKEREIPAYFFPHMRLDGKTMGRTEWRRIRDIPIGKALASPVVCHSKQCSFCNKFMTVYDFYKRTTETTVDELHELSKEDDYDSYLQWLPTEMKEDVMSLVTKTNGMIYVRAGMSRPNNKQPFYPLLTGMY